MSTCFYLFPSNPLINGFKVPSIIGHILKPGVINSIDDTTNDIHDVAKRQAECEGDGTATICLQLLQLVDSSDFDDDITEFTIRALAEAAITCTEPCFSALQTYYECTEDAETLRALNQFSCLQFNGTYCRPMAGIVRVQGNLMSDEPCGNYTFDTCPEACRNVIMNNVERLGCCGNIIANSGFFAEPEAFALCGIDLDPKSCEVCSVRPCPGRLCPGH